MAELPTGTVTFLFTDLEGSTRLWEQFPEAMKDALARHDEILRDAIATHDGYVVKTTGDGVHAAFGTAQDAIAAAVAAQLALTSTSWTEIDDLPVRMGLHTGATEFRDGDYYGTAVNKAARLMSVAHGGQIVVSHATEELLRDSALDGIELVDLGEHRLRDLTRAEHVFQVVAPELPREFPRLTSLDAFPTNLPVQATSFVGRERDVEGVAEALQSSRLVTITGVGGVGKTRLACQVAAEVLAHYDDGAWLCELAAAGDDDTMAQVVAATLGANARSGSSLEDSILEHLRSRELLVVLDNCEHLMDAAGSLAEGILRECPGVRVLATSREGLAVPGEQVRPLRSLSPPSAATIDEAGASEAVRLFVERARAARPDFAVTSANVTAVTEVCRRLDGIPLALELAAARVVSMSPAEMAELLDERFRLLTGGRRTSVERHQTLRAAVDWSYALLDDQARTVFDRLGVFAGSFDNRAAEAIVTGDGIERWDVLDALASLVAKSMVTAEETDDGVTRYQLLETMRQYARERLDDAVAGDHWRRRHAEYYAELATEAARGVRGADEIAWRRRLYGDLDNIRAAVTWAIDRDDPSDVEVGLGIVEVLGYEVVSDRSIGVGTWALRALDRLDGTSPGRRGAVLAAAATEQATRGDHEGARPIAVAAMAQGDAAEGPVPGLAALALSLVEAYSGRADEAVRIVGEVISQLDAANAEPWFRGGFRATSSSWRSNAGDWERARADAEIALEMADAADNPSSLCNARWALGWAVQHIDPDIALVSFEAAIAGTRAGASDNVYGSALARAAALRAKRGDRIAALAALRESISHNHDTGNTTTVIGTFGCGTFALADLGEYERAAVFAGAVSAEHFGGVDVFTPYEREEQQRAIAAARAALGSDTSADAEARGAEMSYDEAVNWALAELDRMLEEAHGAS